MLRHTATCCDTLRHNDDVVLVIVVIFYVLFVLLLTSTVLLFAECSTHRVYVYRYTFECVQGRREFVSLGSNMQIAQTQTHLHNLHTKGEAHTKELAEITAGFFFFYTSA